MCCTQSHFTFYGPFGELESERMARASLRLDLQIEGSTLDMGLFFNLQVFKQKIRL